MKFGKEWELETLRMSPTLAAACLDYKAWKKRLKRECSGTPGFERDLASVVTRVNDTFCRMADAIIHRRRQRHLPSGHRLPPRSPCSPSSSSFPSRALCCTRTRHPFDADAETRAIATAASFAALNRRCLYKLCKRMDRRRRACCLGGPTSGPSLRHGTWMAWLTDVRREHAYDFLGGARVTCLDVLVARRTSPPPECPVCFAPLPDGPDAPLSVVTRCGHCFCGECVFTALGVMGRRGSLRNLAAWANVAKPGCAACPLCRCRDGMLDVWTI